MIIIIDGSVSQKLEAAAESISNGSRIFKAQRKMKIAWTNTSAAMIGTGVVKIQKNRNPTTIDSHDKNRQESNKDKTGGLAKTTVLKNNAPLCSRKPKANAPQNKYSSDFPKMFRKERLECSTKHSKLNKYKPAEKRRMGYLIKNFSTSN